MDSKAGLEEATRPFYRQGIHVSSVNLLRRMYSSTANNKTFYQKLNGVARKRVVFLDFDNSPYSKNKKFESGIEVFDRILKPSNVTRKVKARCLQVQDW